MYLRGTPAPSATAVGPYSWHPAVGPLSNQRALHQNTPLNPISRDIGLLDDASLTCGALLSNHTNQNSVELPKTTAPKYLQLLLPNRRLQ